MKKIKIGVIGCGIISEHYLNRLTNSFEMLEVKACSDLDFERAKKRSEQFNIENTYTVDEILSDQDIDIIVNLTIPEAHGEVCLKALNAGKHVYVEKPLSITREEAKQILSLAKDKNLLVGGAPDTFLGGGIQTCRKLIDDGWIGKPIAANAFMLTSGPETWHPDPEFYYKHGAGPLFDMGPYYLTALVSLLGPVEKVFASQKITFPERTITSTPKYGQKINVEVPTYSSGILNFKNGVIGNLITSFDVWGTRLPSIEIYGSEGTLIVPDPNTFGGPVLIRRMGSNEWSNIPLLYGFADSYRGIGIADMACAIISDRKHRANVELAYHVLDIMHGFNDSAASDMPHIIESTCERPAAFPVGLSERNLDLS
ncbi:MAG: Gfo/Idh/MocA family oxidoreductase [Clostridiaceae bacterium]|nr:Gfo/Idh/MocA family oxidoreductase [Clostridiaceae bacterium]